MLIFIPLEFDSVCNNLQWVEIISEGVLRDISGILIPLFLLKFYKNVVKKQVEENKNEL